MSKKSKKIKKPKPEDIKILSANEIEYYIRHKFELSNHKFWQWFFSECPFGETTLLSFAEDMYYPKEYYSYVKIIKDEFEEYLDDELCLEIENDL